MFEAFLEKPSKKQKVKKTLADVSWTFWNFDFSRIWPCLV
jgi:hypothetical protein